MNVPGGGDERVVLLDEVGRPCGTELKRAVHTADTPLHLGFSCYVVDASGRVLLTQRAATKTTWPGVWTNSCCGHPALGESVRDAVGRRLRDELGIDVGRMAMIMPDFTYRAEMANGVIEHEVCPVVVAEFHGEPRLNPAEVDDAQWVAWDDVCRRAATRPRSLSPWCVEQVGRLELMSPALHALLDRDHDGAALDAPITDLGVSRRPAASNRTAPPPAGGDSFGAFDPLAPIRDDLADALANFIAERSVELIGLGRPLDAIVKEIGALVASGGKRLRPAFVYWGHRAAAGTEPHAGVVAVAAAVEMLHTFALLHDDVMDRSATRRGRPSAHRGLAALHREDGLTGDPEWFGTSAAILAGDLAFLWSDQLFDAAPFDAATMDRARRVFNTMRTEVMAGQYLDLRLGGVDNAIEREGDAATDDAARRVALLKSGRYTITRPLELGFALAGRPDEQRQVRLRTYGDTLGLAFQLRDDILGMFGDPANTGKAVTDDLRDGKQTLLMVRALTLSTAAQRKVLMNALGAPEIDDALADDCRNIIARSGALASVETLVRDLHATAVNTLDGLPEPAASALHALATGAAQRDK